MRHESPGTYIHEVPSSPPPIEGVALTLTAFLGVTEGSAESDHVHEPAEFVRRWPADTPLGVAVEEFFANGGARAVIVPLAELTPAAVTQAIGGLDPDAALVAIPADPVAPPDVVAAAAAALDGTGAMLLLEGPWLDVGSAVAAMADPDAALGASGRDVAVYWPRLRRPRPDGASEDVSPVGAIAGVIARCEDVHGVDHTPAGAEARIARVSGPAVLVDDHEMDPLNTAHVNVVRHFPGLGTVVWGARTLSREAEWKYVPVRRMAVFLERSLRRGLAWTAVEPCDERLWARVRENVSDFLHELFQGGMLEGPSPERAYFVRCDRSTMTQDDIDAGRLIVLVGFAPVRPAEFLTLRLEFAVGAA